MTNADPGSEPYSASIDVRVLLFTLGISLVVSLLFSIAPVFHFLRPDLANALRQNAGTASKGSQRFRKLAVGAQIALSVLLLGGAGLFVRTLDNLRHQPVGFEISESRDLLARSRQLRLRRGPHHPRLSTSALEALRRIPGVASAAATTDPELSGDTKRLELLDAGLQASRRREHELRAAAESRPATLPRLRQPILAGREFTRV